MSIKICVPMTKQIKITCLCARAIYLFYNVYVYAMPIDTRSNCDGLLNYSISFFLHLHSSLLS